MACLVLSHLMFVFFFFFTGLGIRVGLSSKHAAHHHGHSHKGKKLITLSSSLDKKKDLFFIGAARYHAKFTSSSAEVYDILIIG